MAFEFLALLFVAVPTAMFYGWIAIFAWRAWRHLQPGFSKPKALIYGALALAPLAWYGASYGAATVRIHQLTAKIRDGETLPKLANPPRVLVVHGGRADWQDRLVEMGAFDTVYVAWPVGAVKLVNARRPGCDGGARGNVHTQNIFRARTGFLACATETKADTIPADGLHYLLVPPRPTNGRFEWFGYHELKMIENGRETLVGFNGTPRSHKPAMPPVISALGFHESGAAIEHIVPWHGDIPFLFGRLGLDAGKLKPQAQPSAEEVRAEYLRLRDSPNRADQNVAGYIATAAGASALSADDIAPILKTNVIDTDLGREIGFQQFCYHINRLCDYPDVLKNACLERRGFTPEKAAASPAMFLRCQRLPKMCNWCATNNLCQPTLDGQIAGCASADSVARDRSLDAMRENKPD